MPSLYKRRDSPYWWWTATYKGHKVSRSTKLTSKKDAEKLTREWAFSVASGDAEFLKLPGYKAKSLGEYLEYYLGIVDVSKSQNAYAIEKGVFKKFLRYCLTNAVVGMTDIKLRHISGYLESLTTSGKTKRNHLGIIRRMFDYAIRDEIIKNNPAQFVKKPKIIRNERNRLLTDEDLEIIFRESGSWYTYFHFLFHTGLRAGDVALLTIGCIDLERGVITTLIRKSDRMHEIPLHSFCLSLVPRGSSEDPLFPDLYSESERKLNDNLAKPRKYMQRILEIHGKPKATLHSFRHTFNTKLRDGGLTDNDRSSLLAHSSTATTKIYTHPNTELAREHIELLPTFKPPVHN